MTRYDRRVRALAACLSALAGFIDSLAFIKLGGFFVSFMSGNSTRLGVGLARGSAHAAIAGALISAFVLGVILGSVTGHLALSRRRETVLALVTTLLLIGAIANSLGAPYVAVAAMALAMGAENATFQRDGEVTIGLTYMTGTLVKLGQKLTSALLGGPAFDWVPYLLLWMGLVGGALTGAAIYPWVGLGGLWLAAAIAAALTLVAATMVTD